MTSSVLMETQVRILLEVNSDTLSMSLKVGSRHRWPSQFFSCISQKEGAKLKFGLGQQKG